jgi:hypothetical protein
MADMAASGAAGAAGAAVFDMERPSKRPRCSAGAGYDGYCLPDSAAENPMSVETIDAKNIPSAKKFFDTFIRARKPVKITNLLKQTDCDLYSLCKLSQKPYLEKKAGKSMVHVERRQDDEGRFGKARATGEVKMTFSDFLNNKEDNHLYYLSTQPIQLNEEGRPQLMSEPVASLKDDFPLRPTLAGNLIPTNYNLWMGSASPVKGSTSGLHHDFHDNLYCLLSGRKRFILYSPDRAEQMKTRGEIQKIHENGLINYEGDSLTSADGVEVSELRAWSAEKQQDTCEQEVVAAEAAAQAGEQGAEERLERAETALEEAMENVLTAETEDSIDGDGVDFWSTMNEKKKSGDSSPGEEEEEEDADDEDADDEETPPEKLNNFSQIETSPVPGIPYAQVVLEAGDVLFLPAGWFHHVTSYCEHVALNYWFHPPTNSDFEKPYNSQFWIEDWEQRMADKDVA